MRFGYFSNRLNFYVKKLTGPEQSGILAVIDGKYL